MKYTLFLFIGFALLAFFFFVTVDRETLPQRTASQEEQSVNAVQPQWETKIDEQASVAVTVTPVALGEGFDSWKFQIVLDTHSGSLDEDLMRVTTFRDESGVVYAPTAWEGSEPGGHHREGTLSFSAVKPLPSYIELIVKEVGGVPTRSFRWDLQ
mgnify:CR=1 FL=1